MSSPLTRLRFIHFAEWIVFPDLPGGGPGGRPRQPGMLFLADFDGDLPEYLAAFGLVVPDGMKVSFGSTVGFPGPRPTSGLIDYVERHRSDDLHHWSAHPDVTVRDADAALEVVARLERLCRHADDPRRFSARYLELLTALAHAPEPTVPSRWTVVARVLRDAVLRRRPAVAGLSLALPIAAGREGDAADAVRGLSGGGSPPFDAVPGTHVARLAVIGGDGTAHAGVWHPHLLLCARFDGTVRDYVRRLVEGLDPRADDLWAACVGYPGADRPGAVASWLLAHRLPASIFFFASEAPVARIAEAVELRETVLDAVTAAQGRTMAEVRGALLPLSRRLREGDPK